MSSQQSKRLIYFGSICLLVFLGLMSRKIDRIPLQAGDALWAMTLFCSMRFCFVRTRLNTITWSSLALAFADEFSQLIQWEWLCNLRSTWIGHMLLGQGFVWQDLLAYVIGVAVAYSIARLLNDK